MMMKSNNEIKRIETKPEVDTYIDRLKYAIKNGHANLQFQQYRIVDKKKDERFTNRFTVGDLFPNEDPVKALKRELLKIEIENYIETVKDKNCPNKSEMRVFGKRYNEDVYIKIRVELLQVSRAGVNNTVFVMSFHYSEWSFTEQHFPYKKK